MSEWVGVGGTLLGVVVGSVLAAWQAQRGRAWDEWTRRREASADALSQVRLLLADLESQVLVWGISVGDKEEAQARSLDFANRRDRAVGSLTREGFAHSSSEVRSSIDALIPALTKAVNTAFATLMAQGRERPTDRQEAALGKALAEANAVLESTAEALRTPPERRWFAWLRPTDRRDHGSAT